MSAADHAKCCGVSVRVRMERTHWWTPSEPSCYSLSCLVPDVPACFVQTCLERFKAVCLGLTWQDIGLVAQGSHDLPQACLASYASPLQAYSLWLLLLALVALVGLPSSRCRRLDHTCVQQQAAGSMCPQSLWCSDAGWCAFPWHSIPTAVHQPSALLLSTGSSC